MTDRKANAIEKACQVPPWADELTREALADPEGLGCGPLVELWDWCDLCRRTRCPHPVGDFDDPAMHLACPDCPGSCRALALACERQGVPLW